MIAVAILGYGVVGSGVGELIERNNNRIDETDKKIKIKKILVRDLEKHLSERHSDLITNNIDDIFNEEIDIVVEVMGGLHPTYEYIKRALEAKKHVVTANKDLIAEYGRELLETAYSNGVVLLFEASVGGGIPILKALNESLIGNEIKEIKAILNGTTNFILSKMYSENMSYCKALKLAQSLGFAEANPDADVLGYDAGRKLAILSTIAFKQKVDWKDIIIKGITDIDELDFKYAKKIGCNIKLIATSKKGCKNIYAAVEPVIVKRESPLGKVENEYNAVIIEGDAVGTVTFCGKGAGMLPTASSVFSDIMDITNGISHKKFIFNDNYAMLRDTWPYAGQWLIRMKSSNKRGLLEEFYRNFKVVDAEVYEDGFNTSDSNVICLVEAESENVLYSRLKDIQRKFKFSEIKKIRILNE